MWDCLLFEGDITLFRVGLKLLHLKKNELLATEDTLSCYTVLKSSSQDSHSTFTLPKPPKSRNTNHPLKHLSGVRLSIENEGADMMNTSSEPVISFALEDRGNSGRGSPTRGEEGVMATRRKRSGAVLVMAIALDVV